MAINSSLCIVLLFSLLVTLSLSIVAKPGCSPSGKVRGRKPPPGQCNKDNDSECCEEGKLYTVYECSPPVSHSTKATLTMNGFQKGGDGGGPSECDNRYHSNDTPVVALSTGWFNRRSRCHQMINIHANGRSVKALVVDECDSTQGCDSDHDYQPPCPHDWGEMNVIWSDA